MPKVAAVPLSHVPAPETPRTAKREAWQAQPIESRVAALETRWDVTTPTLATSRDISDLRVEMKSLENRLIKWVVGAAAGVLLAMIGIFFSGYNALNGRLDSAVSELRTENRSAITELKVETRSAIADLKEETRAAIADLKEETRAAVTDLRADIRDLHTEIRETNARMETRFEKMDAKFDAMMEELRAQRSDAR